MRSICAILLPVLIGAVVYALLATGPTSSDWEQSSMLMLPAMLIGIMLVALIFLVFGTPCTTFWLWLGTSFKRVLRRPVQFRAFNIVMACLLVGSLVPLVGEAFSGLR